jgi:hypothetical protein
MVRLFLWCVVIGCCLCVSQASATDDKMLRGPVSEHVGNSRPTIASMFNTENTYFDWAEGFMSGMNWIDVKHDRTSKDIMSLSTADQKQLIRNYCNEHPLASFWEAVIDVYNRLSNSDSHFPQNQND